YSTELILYPYMTPLRSRAGRIYYYNNRDSYKSYSNYRQKDCGNSNQRDSCRIHYRSCGKRGGPIRKRRQKSLDNQSRSPYASARSEEHTSELQSRFDLV